MLTVRYVRTQSTSTVVSVEYLVQYMVWPVDFHHLFNAMVDGWHTLCVRDEGRYAIQSLVESGWLRIRG